MAESNLEIRLELITLFGQAAKEAAEQLGNIGTAIKDLVADSESLGAIAAQVKAIDATLSGASTRAGSLAGQMKNLGNAEGIAANAAAKAASGVSSMGNAAQAAAGKIDQTTQAVRDLGSSAKNVSSVAREVQGVAGVSEQARASVLGLLGAVNQAQRGNFSPLTASARLLESNVRNAEKAVRSLNEAMYDASRMSLGLSTPSRQVALNPGRISDSEAQEITAGYRRMQAQDRLEQLAFGSGTNESRPRLGPNRTSYSGRNPNNPNLAEFDWSQPRGYHPRTAIVPSDMIDLGQDQYRAWSGSATTGRFSDYWGKAPRETTRRGKSGINAEFQDMTPESDHFESSVDIQSFYKVTAQHLADRKAFYEGKIREADQRISVGMSSMINFAMGASVLVPLMRSAMQIQNYDTQSDVTVRANDGNAATSAALIDNSHRAAVAYGSGLAETAQSVTGAVSSAPMSAIQNINNPAWVKDLELVVTRASMLSQVSTLGGNPLSPTDASVGINQLISNMNLPSDTVDQYKRSIIDVSDALVKLKSVIPILSLQKALDFSRAVGPVLAQNHMSSEEAFGWEYAFGKEKQIGAPAGNALRRLLTREVLPVPKTIALRQEFTELTHGGSLSMFDKNGKASSLLNIMQQLADADKKYHFSDERRSQILGQLSGPYPQAQTAAIYSVVQKHGAEYVREKGREILHTGISGSKDDPLTAEMKVQLATVGGAASQSKSAISDMALKTFVDISPQLVKLLHGITDLTKAFMGLPAPVRDGIAEFLLFSTALSGVLGVFNLLFGNFEKTAFYIGKIVESSKAGSSAMLKLGDAGAAIKAPFVRAGSAIASFIQSSDKMAIVSEAFAGARAAAVAFGETVAVEFLPVTLAVAAVTLVAVDLWEVWRKNIGNVQGLFADFVKFFQDRVNDFQGIGTAFVSFFPWAGKAIADAVEGWKDPIIYFMNWCDDNLFLGFGKKIIGFAEWIGQKMKPATDKIGAAADKFTRGEDAQGRDVTGTDRQGRSSADRAIEAGGQRFAKDYEHGMDYEAQANRQIGQGVVNFFSGILGFQQVAFHDAGSDIAGTASNVASNIFHPKTNKPPTKKPHTHNAVLDEALKERDAARKEAATYFDDSHATPTPAYVPEDPRVAQIFDAGKKKKAKKAKKVPEDTIINTKDFSIARVEEVAEAIEKTLDKHSPNIKKKWLSLLGPGQTGARIQGNPQVYAQAVSSLGTDPVAAKFKQHLENAKKWRQSYEQEIKKLESYLAQAKSPAMKAYINEHIGILQDAHAKLVAESNKKITFKVDSGYARIFGEEGGNDKKPTGGFDSTATTAMTSFDNTVEKLNRNWIISGETQKGVRDTVSSLKSKYDELDDTLTTLEDSNVKVQQSIDKITGEITEQQKALTGMNGTDAASIKNKADLSIMIGQEQVVLTGLNSQLKIQTNETNQLSTATDLYNKKLNDAIKNQHSFAEAIAEAKDAAAKSVQEKGASLLSGGASNFLEHLPEGGSKRTNPISELVSTYISSYATSLAGPLSKTLLGGDKDAKTTQPIVTAVGTVNTSVGTVNTTVGTVNTSVGGVNTSVGTMSTKVDTTNTKLETINTSISNLHATTAGQTSLLQGAKDNTAVFNGMNQTAAGGLPIEGASQYAEAYTNDAGQASTDNSSFGDWGDSKNTNILKSQTGKTVMGIGGALAATDAGMQQGGVGGALTAGVGTFTALSSAGVPPQIALPAAAISALVAGFSHHDDPAQEPDKYDTTNFGTILANATGAGLNGKTTIGASGQSFTTDMSTAAATNNMGEIQYIQQWAAENVNNQSQAIAANAQAMELKYGQYNPNATTSQILHEGDANGKDLANVQVVGGTESGNYQTVGTDIANALNQIQSATSSMLTAQQNSAELASSFTSNMFGGPSGFTMPYLGSVGGGNASSFVPSTVAAGTSLQSLSPALASAMATQSLLPNTLQGTSAVSGNLTGFGAGTGGASGANVTINLLGGATIGNSSDMQNAVNDSIPTIVNAVNQAIYNQGRYMATYQSQLS